MKFSSKLKTERGPFCTDIPVQSVGLGDAFLDLISLNLSRFGQFVLLVYDYSGLIISIKVVYYLRGSPDMYFFLLVLCPQFKGWIF